MFSRSVAYSYSARNEPRSWSSGTTWSTKSSSPAGVMCGHEDEAVGGVGLHELVDLVGHLGRRADERLAPGDLDDQVADAEVLGLGPLRATSAAVASGSWYIRARPWMIDVADTSGSIVGQRPLGVVGRQVAVPQLLEQQDRRLRADLLAADGVGLLGGVLGRVAEHERGRREDLQLVGRAPVVGQAALDVGEERLPVGQPGVPAEDARRPWRAASSRPPSLSPAWRITGWRCGLRGTLKLPRMSNCSPWWSNAPGGAVAHELPGRRRRRRSRPSAHESHSSRGGLR